MNLARLTIAAATLALVFATGQRQVSSEAAVVAKENTLDGIHYNSKAAIIRKNTISASNPHDKSLSLRFINNLGGDPINAYVVGRDLDGRVFFVKNDGTLIYPSSGGSEVPVRIAEDVSIPLPAQSGSLNMTLPIPVFSGRIYFSQGMLNLMMVKTAAGDDLVEPSVTDLEDPNAAIDWGFVDFYYGHDKSIYASISYVDFVGMILSLSLSTENGETQTVKGLAADSVSQICDSLATQTTTDSYPWAAMCISDATGNPLRVLSPRTYTILAPDTFNNYWTSYIDQVWAKHSETNLFINTQSTAGTVACAVVDGILACAGDNRGYVKPTSADIWSCNSGPFEIQQGDNHIHLAVVPRLCAAIVRSTLLFAGGSTQPGISSASYYPTSPTDHYSRLVHKFLVDGKGYTFPYDDVSPDNVEDSSGVVASGAPEILTVNVGAPPQ